MATFNLADYETVEQRIFRFYGDHPNGRILTENLTTLQDRQVSTWVVKAEIWLPNPLNTEEVQGEQYILKATGLAFEVDSNRGPNQTSALENCETSAIGRALANAGYSGNKRVTREEMAKVERGITPKAPTVDEGALVDWLAAINDATTEAELKEIWAQVQGFADQPVNGTTLKAAVLARKKQVK